MISIVLSEFLETLVETFQSTYKEGESKRTKDQIKDLIMKDSEVFKRVCSVLRSINNLKNNMKVRNDKN